MSACIWPQPDHARDLRLDALINSFLRSPRALDSSAQSASSHHEGECERKHPSQDHWYFEMRSFTQAAHSSVRLHSRTFWHCTLTEGDEFPVCVMTRELTVCLFICSYRLPQNIHFPKSFRMQKFTCFGLLWNIVPSKLGIFSSLTSRWRKKTESGEETTAKWKQEVTRFMNIKCNSEGQMTFFDQ